MATWAKIKFYFDKMLGASGSTLSASSTESADDYDVDYIFNMLETNFWKAANNTDPQYITFDAGSGNSKTADYLAIIGHNLSTIGASVTLQCSDDNFSSDIDYLLAELPASDNVLLSEALVIPNGDLEVWSDGASSTPDGWTRWAPGGGSIERDAVDFKTGLYSAKLTNAASNEALLDFKDTRVPGLDPSYWSSRDISFGIWVKTSESGRVRLVIISNDGSSEYEYSSYHSGGGDWEWLAVSVTLRAGLTSLILRCMIPSGTSITANFDGAVVKEAGSVVSSDVSDYLPVSVSKRYWRLKIGSSLSAAPYIALAIWGDKTELDYASSSFDPHAQNHKANVNVSYGGYVTGIHEQFVERRMSLNFNDADSTLYAKIKTFIDTNGLKNLFIAWELANNETEVFLMRPEPNFNNPLSNGGAYRDINISLIGRKE